MPVAEATKHRLLEAAGEVFAEKGFRAATIRDIRNRTGCNLAAINYHFGDKRKLYVAVVKHIAQQQQEELPLPSWPAGTPAAVKLADFIRNFVRRVVQDRDPRWHIQLMMRELFQPTEACVEFVRQFVRPNFEILLPIVNDILPAGTSEIRRHQVVFSIVGQCLHYRLTRPVIRLLVGPEEFARLDADGVAEHITRFTLAALGLAAPLNAPEGRP